LSLCHRTPEAGHKAQSVNLVFCFLLFWTISSFLPDCVTTEAEVEVEATETVEEELDRHSLGHLG